VGAQIPGPPLRRRRAGLNVGHRTAQATEDLTDAVGSSAIWTFAGLLAAAIAATGAGAAGAPKLIEVQQAEIAVPGREPRA
jgi:hypothetical protein